MARPRAKELTERELEVMHVFWRTVDTADEAPSPTAERTTRTVANVRDELADEGRDLAYTTVATLVRILLEKGFLVQTNDERPYRYRPARSFDEVSGNIVSDLVQRVFGGSREQLLHRLFNERTLSNEERALLEDVLRETE